jgi:hypothetical protein
MTETWKGSVVIPVYNTQTIDNPTTPKAISVVLASAKITWDAKGPPPNLTGSDTLAFTLPTGYTSSFIYQYDLHGTTRPNSSTAEFVTKITSTLASEAPITASTGINFGVSPGTDWDYGTPDNSYPLANVGTMSNPPAMINYTYTNVQAIDNPSWNIHISVGIASNSGPPDPGPGLSTLEIVGIIVLIVLVLIILYYLISYYTSDSDPSDPSPAKQTTGTGT